GSKLHRAEPSHPPNSDSCPASSGKSGSMRPHDGPFMAFDRLQTMCAETLVLGEASTHCPGLARRAEKFFLSLFQNS
ncbi:hypothetical protein, partial [Bradyrhizobium sp. SZCCHNR1093]|uniref:hypothetical protein n=1 Tax=Bradyrhizobium sp. SZCCHNR1093 TaxID=3057368 RepID=UPI0028E7DDA6